MTEIPPDLQARRAVEDEAIRLGRQRHEALAQTAANTCSIIELLRKPEHALIPLDHLAQLLGVSRPSIYRWRERAQEIPADRTVADWLAEQDADGNFVHYKG
jgi:hypothetical protein